jgi:hypothetical protein
MLLPGVCDDPASFGCNFGRVFTSKRQPLRRKTGLMEMAFEGCAAERTYLPQAVGIDKDLSLAAVFLVKQIK